MKKKSILIYLISLILSVTAFSNPEYRKIPLNHPLSDPNDPDLKKYEGSIEEDFKNKTEAISEILSLIRLGCKISTSNISDCRTPYSIAEVDLLRGAVKDFELTIWNDDKVKSDKDRQKSLETDLRNIRFNLIENHKSVIEFESQIASFEKKFKEKTQYELSYVFSTRLLHILDAHSKMENILNSEFLLNKLKQKKLDRINIYNINYYGSFEGRHFIYLDSRQSWSEMVKFIESLPDIENQKNIETIMSKN